MRAHAAAAAWGPLAEPVDPMETVLRYRAQSVLVGIECADGDTRPLLPIEQARDVLAWHERRQRWVL